MSSWLRVVLDLPRDDRGSAAFWSSVLGRPLAPWPDHRDPAGAAPADGEPSVHRRRVLGPPSLHPVIEVADVPAATARLAGLGATEVHAGADRSTLRSPGGLELELVRCRPHRPRPAPTTSLTGRPRRLVQVCLDLPPQHADREAAFWRAVLPWPEVEVAEPEFLGRLVPPPGAPLQVLLQRLGDDDGGTVTRLHLDLGSEDLAADVRLLEHLGATRTHAGDGFVALRDPAGLPCCVTRHSPDVP